MNLNDVCDCSEWRRRLAIKRMYCCGIVAWWSWWKCSKRAAAFFFVFLLFLVYETMCWKVCMESSPLSVRTSLQLIEEIIGFFELNYDCYDYGVKLCGLNVVYEWMRIFLFGFDFYFNYLILWLFMIFCTKIK
jgi:hypothetical protein